MTEQMEHEHRRGHPALRGLRVAGFVLLGVVGAAVFALAFGYFVMLLWNWLMPAIFHLGTIGYWQAFGIVILAKLIFGSVGGGAGKHHGRGHRHWGPRPDWGKDWGKECGKDWKEDWGGDRWRFYRDFWKEEGKDAFDRYVEKKRGGTGTSAE
jgi:hypothetical protein